jgi:hypothetical protein
MQLKQQNKAHTIFTKMHMILYNRFGLIVCNGLHLLKKNWMLNNKEKIEMILMHNAELNLLNEEENICLLSLLNQLCIIMLVR